VKGIRRQSVREQPNPRGTHKPRRSRQKGWVKVGGRVEALQLVCVLVWGARASLTTARRKKGGGGDGSMAEMVVWKNIRERLVERGRKHGRRPRHYAGRELKRKSKVCAQGPAVEKKRKAYKKAQDPGKTKRRAGRARSRGTLPHSPKLRESKPWVLETRNGRRKEKGGKKKSTWDR